MKTILKNKIFYIITAVAILTASQAFSYVGKVVALRGTAWSVDNNQQQDLQVQSDIFKNHEIHTGKRSRLQIMFNDETIASLGPESTMIINNYEWNDKSQKFEAETKSGLFHILGGKIVNTAPQNFNVKTPLASIGIRGSMFAFQVDETKMSVVFLGGKGINVTSLYGDVALINAGFGTNIYKDLKKIEKPKKFNIQDIEKLTLPFSQNQNQDNDSETPESLQKEETPYTPQTNESLRQPLENDYDTQYAADDKNIEDTKIKIENKDEEIFDQQNNLSGLFQDYTLTGYYDSSSNSYRTGTINAVKDQNLVTVNATDKNLDSAINLSFSTDSFNSSDRYPETDYLNSIITKANVNINKTAYEIEASVFTSDLNEFYTIYTPITFVENTTEPFYYSSLLYCGQQSSSQNYPSVSASVFKGYGVGTAITQTQTNYTESASGEFQMGVNWKNNKVIGRFGIDKYSQPDSENSYGEIFFFGSIDENNETLSQIQVVGTKLSSDETNTNFPLVASFTQGKSTGSFFGSQYQGVGIQFESDFYDITSGADSGDAFLTLGGFKKEDISIPVSDTDVKEWNGFFVGIGENINQISEKAKFFNYQPQEFKLNLYEAGYVSGEMALYIYDSYDPNQEPLQIGGDQQNSAYINDNLFIAQIQKTSTTSENTANFLICADNDILQIADPNSQEYEYASWGYWELSYNATDSVTNETKTYHIHMPGSYWVAGSLTPDPVSVLQELTAQSGTLTYEGITESVLMSGDAQMIQNPRGNFTMNIDIANYNADITINPTGDAGVSFNYQGNIDSQTGVINSHFYDTDTYGSLNGAFFGPKAETTAGNFEAHKGTDDYYGIFIGNKK